MDISIGSLCLISTHEYIHGYIHGYPYPRQPWYFPMDLVPNAGLGKFRHGTLTVDRKCCQQSTDDRRLLITTERRLPLCTARSAA